MTGSTVCVFVSLDERLLITDAARRLSCSPPMLMVDAATAFTRLCGFRGRAVVDIRIPPFWRPRHDARKEIITVSLRLAELEYLQLGAGYVHYFDGFEHARLSLAEFIAGSTARMLVRWVDSRPELFGLSAPGLNDPRGDEGSRNHA